MIVKNRFIAIITLAIIINLVAGYYLVLSTDRGSISGLEYNALSNSDKANLQEVIPAKNC